VTRYKLPDELGGGEFDGQPLLNTSDGSPAGRIFLHITPDRSEYLVLDPARLTEVRPPVPAEPEPGAYLIGGTPCVRIGSAWVVGIDQPDPRWWVYWRDGGVAKLVGGPDVPIVRLVPESSDRAQPPTVVLPWRHKDSGGDSIEIAHVPTPAGEVAALVVEEGSEHSYCRAAMWLDSHEARMGAVAAIMAADRAIRGAE